MCIRDRDKKGSARWPGNMQSQKRVRKKLWLLCKFEAYVNDGDIHFKDQLSQINIKCIVLAKLYPHDLDNVELFSNLKDVILLLKMAKVNAEQLDFTPQGLI